MLDIHEDPHQHEPWRDLPGMLKEAFRDWRDDEAPRLGAALSYYTIFSLAPLLIIAVAIAGLVFGREAAEGRIADEIGGVLGEGGGAAIEAMVAGAREPAEGIIASVVGLVALLFGASGAFNGMPTAELLASGNLQVHCRYPEAMGLEDLLVGLRLGLEEFKPSLVVLDSPA